jgi:hypothetical protein
MFEIKDVPTSTLEQSYIQFRLPNSGSNILFYTYDYDDGEHSLTCTADMVKKELDRRYE